MHSGSTNLKGLQAKEIVVAKGLCSWPYTNTTGWIEECTAFDSFFSLVFPLSPDIWKDNMCVAGGAQTWIEGNKTTALPAHITPEDKEYYANSLRSGGLTAPLCWYKVLVDKSNGEDDANVPSTAYELNKPVLFVAFNKDVIGLPVFGDTTHSRYVKGPLTRKEVEGDHWAVMSHAVELNEILVKWIEGLEV
ncbi:hypothetical protein C8R46DRAFT_1066900 [Mycena filopes]|nr:hypothetical protein C8R46DRAFT_1066900 [Mycena filopes]